MYNTNVSDARGWLSEAQLILEAINDPNLRKDMSEAIDKADKALLEFQCQADESPTVTIPV